MIDIPEELATTQELFNGDRGREFIAALPTLIEDFLERWDLRPDGSPMHGVTALVLPVLRRADDAPAVLKLQLLDEESAGEPLALRLWDGDGAVRLLDHDPVTHTMLLERLDSTRMLATLPSTRDAVLVIAHLLAHLTA
ncbi:aminoglycoside phosphotransferase family protein, partial [Streptomyces sp. RP5T]|uniref:aminoglycoside phosphotransferase family protein n=1 Tax=Streptomyces sp. RP5T TaxID=2490848 RepID=UPI001C8C241A